MSILNNQSYINELNKICSTSFVNWDELKDKIILLSGSTGMIGSYLIDSIMKKNILDNLNCTIIALGRNEEKAKNRFQEYWDNNNFIFVECDINKNIELNNINKIDYCVHLASNTHPKAYALDPIGTIMTNIIGTQNLLDLSYEKDVNKFIFISSCEIYGENNTLKEEFSEDDLGYINCNTLRAGYPESKRCGEALCQAYIKQNDMDISIIRFPRTYGPTMLMSDTKALSQFIKNGLNNENIVLKSEGTQFYSYIYVFDAVTAIIKVMIDGKNGEAYNVSDKNSNVYLKDLANIIAKLSNTNVIFEKPDSIEKAGFSKATKSVLNCSKIKKLGWYPIYNIKCGIKETIDIMSELVKDKKE